MLTAIECLDNLALVRKYQPWVNVALADFLGRRLPADTRRICDMGTGPGLLAVELARVLPYCEIVALDYNPAMLQLTRAELTNLGPQAIQVIPTLGDVHELPFNDGEFDAIVSYSCFHHWSEPARGLAECVRVTRPGGVIHIIDARPDPTGEVTSFVRTKISEPAQRDLLLKAINEAVSENQLAHMLKNVGIRNAVIKDFVLDTEALMAALDYFNDNFSLDSDQQLANTSWWLEINV